MASTSQASLGEYLRDEGITIAITNAEDKLPGWSIDAMRMLSDYLQGISPNVTFMAEDIRDYAKSKGLPTPPSKRAWGAIIVKAKKQGLIKFVEYDQVKNAKAHRANAIRWRKA